MLKKIICILLMAIATFSIETTNAYAYTVPSYVRIGLTSQYGRQESITVSNNQVIVGYELAESFVTESILTAQNQFSIQASRNYFLKVETYYSAYENAKAVASSFSPEAVPASLDIGSYTIYIPFATEAEAKSHAASLNFVTSLVYPNERQMLLKDGATTLLVFDGQGNPQLKAYNRADISLGQKSYRDRIEFIRNSSITAVNVLSLEEYLYSVVPSEMPSSWPVEALKAQAVAARSYALSVWHVHRDAGYHLCDTIHCQAYGGYLSETTQTTAAVDATKGKIAVYNNEPINATFFSSSGGATEDSENVWIEALPYLRSVTEINETTPKIWTRTYSLANLNQLLLASGDSIGQAVDMKITKKTASGRALELTIVGTSGTKVLTKDDVRTFFSRLDGSLDSTLFKINGTLPPVTPPVVQPEIPIEIPTEMPSSVYVIGKEGVLEKNIEELLFKDANGEMIQLNASVFVSSAEAKSQLNANQVSVPQSNTFNIPQANASSVENASGVFVLNGRGYGHGVGMSQYGAKGMAELGYSYENIIKYYYTGVDIQ